MSVGIFILILIFMWGQQVAQALTIKVGVLAPEGTAWAQKLKKMTKEVKKATQGEIRFKIYYGGVQGDEPDVLRKIRVGQLHGGIFTGKTLGDIDGNVRVVEIPFNFQGDREQAWKMVEKMSSYFNKRFLENKFVNLGFFELGFVYIVSRKNIPNLDALKKVKMWTWEGDKLADAMIDSMELVSVPLALPDVLTSFSTGIIQAAYAPPMGIVALQWNSKIKYLIDLPIAYSMGAFLIDERQWKKIPSPHQKIIRDIGARYILQISRANDHDNKEALRAMKELGVHFIKFSEQDKQRAASYRKKVITKLTGKLFTPKAIQKFEEFNKSHSK